MDLESEINNSNAINILVDQYSSNKYLYTQPNYSIEFCKMVKQIYLVYSYKASSIITNIDGIIIVLFNFIKNEINEENSNIMNNDVIINALSALANISKYGIYIIIIII